MVFCLGGHTQGDFIPTDQPQLARARGGCLEVGHRVLGVPWDVPHHGQRMGLWCANRHEGHGWTLQWTWSPSQQETFRCAMRWRWDA